MATIKDVAREAHGIDRDCFGDAEQQRLCQSRSSRPRFGRGGPAGLCAVGRRAKPEEGAHGIAGARRRRRDQSVLHQPDQRGGNRCRCARLFADALQQRRAVRPGAAISAPHPGAPLRWPDPGALRRAAGLSDPRCLHAAGADRADRSRDRILADRFGIARQCVGGACRRRTTSWISAIGGSARSPGRAMSPPAPTAMPASCRRCPRGA